LGVGRWEKGKRHNESNIGSITGNDGILDNWNMALGEAILFQSLCGLRDLCGEYFLTGEEK
jgi:hypothetical protein